MPADESTSKNRSIPMDDTCEGLNKYFGELLVLKDVSIKVKQGEVLCILGPSGSGKSTFIRTLNGIESINSGTITVDQKKLTHKQKDIDAIRKETGMVFQQFNLFPHMTIKQNIMLSPAVVRKWSKVKAEQKAESLLKRVGIYEQANKFPSQLSGGNSSV